MKPKPDASWRARLRAEAERSLTPDAARIYLTTPVSPEEREQILTLVRWFRRRYPEPLDRLAYVRRAWWRWAHREPIDR